MSPPAENDAVFHRITPDGVACGQPVTDGMIGTEYDDDVTCRQCVIPPGEAPRERK